MIFLYISVRLIVEEKIKVEKMPTTVAERIVTAVICPGSSYPKEERDWSNIAK